MQRNTLRVAVVLAAAAGCARGADLVWTGAGHAATGGVTADAPRVLVSAPEDLPFKHLSWPKLARTPQGTLVLAYSAGIGHNIGASGLAVSVSADGGKTFSPPNVLKRFPADDSRYRDCGNMALGIAGDGAAVVLAMAYHGNERNTVFGYRSEDEGRTWRAVDTSALAENKTGSVYGHVLALPDGRLAVFGHYREGSAPHTQGIWLAYSGDDGRTWGPHQRVVEQKTQEPAIVYTREGFVGLLRTWGGRAEYEWVAGADGKAWRTGPNALGVERKEGYAYPSPFIAVDPRAPDRLWALESARFMDGGKRRAAITLWMAGLGGDAEPHAPNWQRVGRVADLGTGETAGHTDFTYPWMVPLGDDRWLMVYYSGNPKGKSDIYGLTLRLDPKAEPSSPQCAIPARARYLVLDSRVVDRVENARLAVGTVKKHPRNPLFGEDKPWEQRFDNLYANVLYDEESARYRCWYSPFIVDEAVAAVPRAERAAKPYRPGHREMGICYAESSDGLNWTKPSLKLVEFQGSKDNNLVLRGPHGTGVLRDARATDPQRRYKMLYDGMAVRFSADGLHWSSAVPCPGVVPKADTHNNAFWVPELQRYAAITRLWSERQRLVARTESPDFIHWTKGVAVLRGEPQAQTYAMPVFRYADLWLGLAMILHRQDDRVDCELAWSADTVHWQRIDAGTPLIPNGSKGEYDCGCVYAAATPVVRQDEIRLYYGGSNGPHGGWRDGSFCLATLRPDGFAGFEPVDQAQTAVVVTRPVVCPGKPLRVTADAAGGSLRVAILDAAGGLMAQGEPLTGDLTDAAVPLPPNTLAGYAGKPVALRIELTRAKLYSFAFAP
jgi:hypothetical protein